MQTMEIEIIKHDEAVRASADSRREWFDYLDMVTEAEDIHARSMTRAQARKYFRRIFTREKR